MSNGLKYKKLAARAQGMRESEIPRGPKQPNPKKRKPRKRKKY